MSSQRIFATYRIETPHPLERAAEAMAGEQSTGTFVRVPGETEELRRRFGARVERITELEAVDQPSLPGSRPPRGTSGPIRYRRAEVVLSFPLENMGPSLPNLLATVAGNLYELREFSGPEADRPRPAARLRRGLPRPAVRRRGDAPARRRRGPADHRHDHQAERRPDARGDRGAGGDLDRGGARLHQGRRTDGQPAPLAPRAAGRGGDARGQRLRRPDRQEADGRLQHHRRDRRDAPASRRGARRPAAPA